MDTLRRFLSDYDMAMLRALARRRGMEIASNRHADAVDEALHILGDPLSVRITLGELGEKARLALDVLLAAGGQMRAAAFSRRFGTVRPLGPGRLERDQVWQEPASPAEELLYAGLVYRGFQAGEGSPGEFFFVPEELVSLLPPPAGTSAEFGVEGVFRQGSGTIGGLDEQAGSGQALVRDVFAYLVFLQGREVRPYADGRLGRSDAAALRGVLSDGDERRLAFVRHLVDASTLVVRRAGHLALQAGPAKRWLSDSPGRQLAVLQRIWRDDRAWDDLCRVAALECDDKAPWRQQRNPADTRRALLGLLSRCPVDEWWTAESFIAAVKAADADFQRPDGDYSSWYIRDAATGEYLSGYESWDQVEGALIRDLLQGPLCWLGIVARAAHGGRDLCRITTSGAQFLGLSAEDSEPFEPPPIQVGTDLAVHVPEPVNLYARFQLERFADLEKESPCRYRLSAEALGRAHKRGIRVSQVVAFLQQASGGTVPPNVVVQLRLWAGRFDQLELVEGALVTVRDEVVMKELSMLPETRVLIHRILSPTTALVRKQDVPRLRKVLRELGYLGGDA